MFCLKLLLAEGSRKNVMECWGRILQRALDSSRDTLTKEKHRLTRDAISISHSYLQLRNIALDLHYCGHIVSVPTHIVADVEDHTVQFFSQRSRDGYECSA